jgi:predicted transcriptional regulator
MPDDLELAARFVAALFEITRGRPGHFRRIDEVADWAGIEAEADIQQALRAAESAGLLVTHVYKPMAMLTEEGLEAARSG